MTLSGGLQLLNAFAITRSKLAEAQTLSNLHKLKSYSRSIEECVH